jgi:CrcB protein
MGTVIAVGLGGALGALARYGLGGWIGQRGAFPWSTLVINVLGSAILGAFVAFSVRHLPIHPWLRSAVVVGFLGAFTTFSTFTLETVRLLDGDRFVLAALYVGASVVGCVAALKLALVLGR